MRRGLRAGQTRPSVPSNHLSRDLDWMLDKWSDSSPEVKMQLILAKIKHEDKESSDKNRKVV